MAQEQKNDVMGQHSPWSSHLHDYLDEEPTIKMKIPPQMDQDDSWQKSRGVNWGLIVGLLFCLAFWGSVYWVFTR